MTQFNAPNWFFSVNKKKRLNTEWTVYGALLVNPLKKNCINFQCILWFHLNFNKIELINK